MPIPAALQEVLDDLDLATDRADRIQYLISLADGFQPVPENVATRPFPEEHRVPGCESEAFVFSTPNADGSRNLYFAVENPQGVSAMAMAAILANSLSGADPKEVEEVSTDVVYRIFGRELSMGKSMGLMGMVQMAKSQMISRER